ncbi:hypothetical protein N7476_008808 [Penicillium atrosanguineum]|uniref:RRM domain-containing protein n=1 Tax=Penicillium atrosanguineum TaxID=1132637 RepID=A0A9W9U223_9EURO|nr:hypothetical protein N7476_008808 [Penicillium atrosanguineum]
MLKPFQIRDLHVSSSPAHGVNSDLPVSHGVVQISAADYDDIASSHPRARLAYIDYEDDEQITVGSSLELSERLDEPVDINERLDSIHVSREEAETMHRFDIRRSNSVLELWRRFENTSNEAPKDAEMTRDTSTTAETAINTVQPVNKSASEDITSPATAPEEDPQPLMAAFEAELSNILESSETFDTQAQGTRSEPAREPSANISSHGIPPVVEQFMAQMLQQICSGVGVMQTELRTRIPELRHQLSEAQRELPENLATSLQALFTHLEAQMRTAFNNLPENGRHMAEEAIQAGKPVAETAVESLRSFATDLDQSTRTLFAAFENEFGRAGSQNTSTTTGSSNAAPGVFFTPPNSVPVPPVPSQESQIHPSDTPTQQKDITASGQTSVRDSGSSYAPRPQPASNPHIEQETQPWNHSSHPPPNWPSDGKPYAQHFQPSPQPPSWASFNANQPWHLHAHPPRHYAHHPPPPRHYTPVAFPPWSSGPPPMPPFLPHGMQQPLNSLPHNHTSAPPPYKVQTHSKNGGNHTETPENKILFIGNVGFNVTEKMIQDVFASKGFIVEVDLPLDSMSGKHAGFGYLQFPTIHPAMAAMNALQGFHIDGHAINLEFSDQMPIERIPASQPSSKAAKSSSLGAQMGSSQSESVHVSDTSVPQEKALRKEEVIPEETVGENSKCSVKRTKSVTFQEPVLSVPEISSSSANAPRAAPPALIDLADDSASNAPPVWGRSHSPPLSAGHPTEREMIDLGMNRFPPVSQLDAHLRANQRQDRASVPPHGVSPGDYASFRRNSRSRLDTDAPVDSATALGANMQDRPTKLPGAKDYNENSSSGGKPLPKVKRSETVKQPFEYASPNDSTAEIPLRRRATERDSLRPSARQRAEIDTWARLDRRERLRSRPSSTQSIPGSFPIEETSQSATTNASPSHSNGFQDPYAESIDNCISSLVDMGYGTPAEGGRSRMAVYAAASNGSLLDAIEMIEEERKAYARQHRQ